MRCPPCKILVTILVMDDGRTLKNVPEDKKANDDILGFIPEGRHRHIIGVKEKEDDESPALKIPLMHRYENFRTIVKEQRIISATNNSINNIRTKQNYFNYERELGNEANVWIFQAKNRRNLTQGNLDWRRKGKFKRETESLPIDGQNNTKRTNYVKVNIDEMQ